MTGQERKDREDRALEALIVASFLKEHGETDAQDDPRILDEEDREAMKALGEDLVDRVALGILAGRSNAATDEPLVPITGGIDAGSPSGLPGVPVAGAEIAALHRGDEKLTREAIEEMEQQARRLLGGTREDE
jgi:hypothetical protein